MTPRDILRGGLRSGPVTRAASTVAACYLRFALHTTRWRFDGSDAALREALSEPSILAFWHERSLMMPIVWRLSRLADGRPDAFPKVNILISRHHDGRLIARIMARFGGRAVHGSSAREKGGRTTERGGAAAIRRLAALLRDGGHVIVTPDGPRGPARSAKPGLAHLALLSGRPILPCSASSRPHLRLPTWDRLMVPLPFGRGVLAFGAPMRVEPGAAPPIEAALDDAMRRSDRLP